MSLKLQQTSGTGGSNSGRRVGPASKTNRLPAEIIDIDGLDDIPLSQTINPKSTNQSNEIKSSDMKKSLIPLATNEKNNQVSTPTTTTTSSSTSSSSSSEIKNNKESNSLSKITDKKDNNKNTEKNGHNNDQSKLQSSTQPQSQKESLKSTNGHKIDDDGKNKKSIPIPTKNGNEEQKDNKTKEDKSKSPATTDQQITISPNIESDKQGPKIKKLSEKDKKKTNDEDKKKTNDEITTSNIDVQLPSQPIITPLKRTSQRAAAIQANASLSSLANEKELKGFNEIGDEEMESLLLQIDTSEEIEKAKPLLTPTKTNIVVVEKKIEQQENKKIIETKKIDDTTKKSTTKKSPTTVHFSQPPPITSTPDAKQQHTYLSRPSSASVRSISARRSLRPINKEFSFQNTTNYRESYRKIQTEFDYTGNNTSLNVTVGSEITPSDQLSTSASSSFSFFGRGKKRERTSPQQSETSQKSPQEYCQLIKDGDSELDTSVSKRARLDFSGFFGMVASPVTMLRARLARAKIQSTPKLNDDDIEVEEGVENFSGIIGDNKKNDNNQILNNQSNEGDDKDVEIEEISMNDDDDENDMKNFKDMNDDEESEDNEIIVTEVENRRRMCLLM